MRRYGRVGRSLSATVEHVLQLAEACGGAYRSQEAAALAEQEGTEVLGVYVFPRKANARDFYRRVKATQPGYVAEVQENDPTNRVVVKAR